MKVEKFEDFKDLNENKDGKVFITRSGEKVLRDLEREWRTVEKWVLGDWQDTKYGGGYTFFEEGPFTLLKLLQTVSNNDGAFDTNELEYEFNGEFNGDHENPDGEIKTALQKKLIEIK